VGIGTLNSRNRHADAKQSPVRTMKKVLSCLSSGMTKAAMRLPITCEAIRNAQKKLLKNPELAFWAQFEMYLPYPTHRIAAPNPQIAADTRIKP